MQDALIGHLLDRLALGEGFGERDERPLDQRDVQRRWALQQLAGLVGEFRVGQRKRREQVPQELVADAVGELDRVDGHELRPLPYCLHVGYAQIIHVLRTLHCQLLMNEVHLVNPHHKIRCDLEMGRRLLTSILGRIPFEKLDYPNGFIV